MGVFGLVRFSCHLYSRSALIKASYRFTDRVYIHLDADDDYYYVTMENKNIDYKVDHEKEFMNELLEQVNRELVIEQTKDIREILYARAMASTVIYEDALESIEAEIEDDTAMKDWFANE